MENHDSAQPAAITPAHILAEAAADLPPAPGADPAAAPAAAPPAVDPHAEAVDLVEFAGSLFFPVYPSLVPVYPPDVRKRIAAALAPLMVKYGWSMSGFGPEVIFGLTIVPLIAPTVQAIRADRQAKPAGDPVVATPAGEQAAPVEAEPPNPLAAFPGQLNAGE